MILSFADTLCTVCPSIILNIPSRGGYTHSVNTFWTISLWEKKHSTASLSRTLFTHTYVQDPRIIPSRRVPRRRSRRRRSRRRRRRRRRRVRRRRVRSRARRVPNARARRRDDDDVDVSRIIPSDARGRRPPCRRRRRARAGTRSSSAVDASARTSRARYAEEGRWRRW